VCAPRGLTGVALERVVYACVVCLIGGVCVFSGVRLKDFPLVVVVSEMISVLADGNPDATCLW